MADKAALVRAFLTKALWNIPTIQALVDHLKSDSMLFQSCGWNWKDSVPSPTTFSWTFKEFETYVQHAIRTNRPSK